MPVTAVRHLLEGLTSLDPAAKFHAFLNEVAPVDYLTHVQYVLRSGTGLAAPELLAGHAVPDIRNTTAQCFAIYRKRFWRQDECTAVARRLSTGEGSLAMVRFTPSDSDAPAWRRDVYRRMQVEDRLSIVYSPAPGAVFGLNMYRARRHGCFGSEEISRMRAVAPLLLQVHRILVFGSARDKPSLTGRLEHVYARLQARVPELSRRECETCTRIACGMTAEGIAEDLRIACSSVTTLRKRAYAKLRKRGFTAGRAGLGELCRQ